MVADNYSFNKGVVRRFGTADYVVFVTSLVISSGIGIFYAIWDRKRNTTKDFQLGGKNMNVFPVAMSLMVTFMSANTILGNPAEVYNYNTMYVWVAVCFIFAITGAAFIFMPFFYDLQVTSTFEYLQLRFSLPVRILSSSLLILQTLMYMAFLLYSPSLALNAVTGVKLWGCVVGMAFVVTLYTALGGMKAVLWTDTFQAGVIFAGLLAVLIQGSIVQGGFVKAWEIADNRSRILLDEFNFDPKTRHSVWSLAVGGIFFWVYLYGINQAQIQRCLACPSVKKAQIAMFVNLPGIMLIVILCSMIGVIMYAFYSDCHPVTYGVINKIDELLPLYVMDILGHVTGVPGIFVSCLVAGSLSSMSSGLNAMSAIVIRDWTQGFKCCHVSDFKSTIISKLLVAGFGLVAIGLTYVVSQLGDILQAVYVVFGVLNGPVLGVMTLGMFFPWANKWGALTGVLGSLLIMLWIGMGAFVNGIRTIPPPTFVTACNWTARPTPAPPITTTLPVVEESLTLEPLYRMSYMWYTGLGMILVWGVGMFVSVLTGLTKPSSLDARLVLPIFDKLFPYLPEKILKPLRFGIVHKGKYDRHPRDINKMSPETAGNSRSEKEKSSHDVTNGHVAPKTRNDNIDSKDVKIEIQSQENKAYHADNDEGDGVTKTRL